MDKYAPEILMSLMSLVYNIVLIVSCTWTITKLCEMSHSWHCLWVLLMLSVIRVPEFVRD